MSNLRVVSYRRPCGILCMFCMSSKPCFIIIIIILIVIFIITVFKKKFKGFCKENFLKVISLFQKACCDHLKSFSKLNSFIEVSVWCPECLQRSFVIFICLMYLDPLQVFIINGNLTQVVGIAIKS